MCATTTSEHSVDVPAPQFGHDSAEVVRSAPRVAEQLIRGRAEHAVEVRVLRFWKRSLRW